MFGNNDLLKALKTAGSAVRTNEARAKIYAQNAAMADVLPSQKGESPYRRRMIDLKNKQDPKMGTNHLEVKSVHRDPTPFPKEYDPTHPAADENGMVERPNVNFFIEQRDHKAALKSVSRALNMAHALRRALNEKTRILGR